MVHELQAFLSEKTDWLKVKRSGKTVISAAREGWW